MITSLCFWSLNALPWGLSPLEFAKEELDKLDEAGRISYKAQEDKLKYYLTNRIIDHKNIEYCLIIDEDSEDEFPRESTKKQVESAIKVWAHNTVLNECGVFDKSRRRIYPNKTQIKDVTYPDGTCPEVAGKDYLVVEIKYDPDAVGSATDYVTLGFYDKNSVMPTIVVNTAVTQNFLRTKAGMPIESFESAIKNQNNANRSRATNSYDVLIHETGHAFGLCDQYPQMLTNCDPNNMSDYQNKRSTMYNGRYYSSLSHDDTVGLMMGFDRAAKFSRLGFKRENITAVRDNTIVQKFEDIKTQNKIHLENIIMGKGVSEETVIMCENGNNVLVTDPEVSNQRNLILEYIASSIIKQDPESLKRIAESGLDLNFSSDEGVIEEPFHTVLRLNKGKAANIVELLIKAKVNINKQESVQGATPLMLAVDYKDLASTILLLDNGADPNIKDFKGETALMAAAYLEDNNTGFFKLLLTKGADLHARNNDGMTVLMFAAYSNNLSLVKFLIEDKKANINDANDFGASVLMHAVSNNATQVAEFLILKGANIKSKTKFGTTLLMRAAAFKGNASKIIDMLVNKRVDVKIKNQLGWNAITYAVRGGEQSQSFIFSR